MAELKEEIERLRSIRESEKETDWWNQALVSLRQPAEKNKIREVFLLQD